MKSRLLRYHRGFIAYEAVHLGLNVLAPKAKNLRPACAGSPQWPELATMPNNVPKRCAQPPTTPIPVRNVRNAQQCAQTQSPRPELPQCPTMWPGYQPLTTPITVWAGSPQPQCPTMCPNPVRAAPTHSGQNATMPNNGVGSQPPTTPIMLAARRPERATMRNNLPNPVPPTTAITLRAGSPQWPERATMPNNLPKPGVGCQLRTAAITVWAGSLQWPERATR